MTAMARLEPPYTRSAGEIHGRIRHQAVGSALPLWRGGRSASRWHRPRSGVRIWSFFDPPEGRLCLQMWCGTSTANASHWLGVERLPDGEPLCGTCEGRAIGAGYPATGAHPGVPLRFDPRSQYRPPPVCPAVRNRLVPAANDRWFACPACRARVRWRASTRGYGQGYVNVERHEPGPGLIDPCPFHGWDQLVLGPGDLAHCHCRPPEATP